MEKASDKTIIYLKWFLVVCCSVGIAVLGAIYKDNSFNELRVADSFHVFMNVLTSGIFKTKIFWFRFELLFLSTLFIGSHFIFNIKALYEFIYKYRWVIGFALLVFLTANQIHGDSINMYDQYVQSGQGSDFVEPLFGEPRAIRSDEWIVEESRRLSARFLNDPYGKYNNILRGTDTVNKTYVGVGNAGKLGNSFFSIFYRILGIEYGFCFEWNAGIIFSFLFTFEFFMILSKQNKLLSTLGSVMIIGSSFFLWWGFPPYIMATHAAIVGFYYFFKSDRWKIKIICATITPIAVANFVTNIYPAWQVPMAYIFLVFLIWVIHENWEYIKNQDIKAWILFGCALVFCVALIATYLFSIMEYLEGIMSTTYPAARVSTGEYCWNKMLYYIQSFLYPYKDIGNSSEFSTMCSLFPLPVILGIIYIVKEKGKDWLINGLVLVEILLLSYTSIGLPLILAKISLLSFSTSIRAIDMAELGCIYLIFIVLSKKSQNEEQVTLNKFFGGLISLGIISISVYYCMKDFPDYMPLSYIIIIIIILTIFVMTILCKMDKKVINKIYVCVIVLFVITGLSVRPVQKGFDAIDSKPLAKEIRKINEKDPGEKWIAYTSPANPVLSAFCVSSGAATINSVNDYPNLELWEALDKNDVYEDVYNRYSHVNISFSEEETSFELIQTDWMNVIISYKDLEKTDVKYIVSNKKLKVDNEYVKFKKLYSEENAYIYEIYYKQ